MIIRYKSRLQCSQVTNDGKEKWTNQDVELNALAWALDTEREMTQTTLQLAHLAHHKDNTHSRDYAVSYAN
jgi:hypothetical protein